MDLAKQYEKFGISEKVVRFSEEIEKAFRGRFDEIERTAEYNQLKVIRAMQENRVSDAHFDGTAGYGYDDLGRDALEAVYAVTFGAEAALVRPQLISGTHALATALFGNLRPGDELLLPAGRPYDTLEEVIGIRESVGSLKEFGISYREVALTPEGGFDYENIEKAIGSRTKLAEIQRSRGYARRPSFSVAQIGELISFLRGVKPDIICLVDNCYGEFVETEEPVIAGADLVAGSLIKNPGGGLAPTGGYIAGRKDCVERSARYLTAPGLGREVGPSLGLNRRLYQGLFLAPSVVASASKGAVFAAAVYERLGFEVSPKSDEPRYDIVQSINFSSPDKLIKFCEGIQAAAAVNSFVRPEPSPMPGYDSEIIMAAGTFIQGSSIELSADAPLRPPYTAYLQGGLTYSHAKLGILKSVQNLMDAGFIKF